jgi:hypothetical protein
LGVPVAKVVERFKTGIDATVPYGADPFRFERIRIPGERKLDLAAYGIRGMSARSSRCRLDASSAERVP